MDNFKELEKKIKTGKINKKYIYRLHYADKFKSVCRIDREWIFIVQSRRVGNKFDQNQNV